MDSSHTPPKHEQEDDKSSSVDLLIFDTENDKSSPVDLKMFDIEDTQCPGPRSRARDGGMMSP
jgi:hypothetical protein